MSCLECRSSRNRVMSYGRHVCFHGGRHGRQSPRPAQPQNAPPRERRVAEPRKSKPRDLPPLSPPHRRTQRACPLRRGQEVRQLRPQVPLPRTLCNQSEEDKSEVGISHTALPPRRTAQAQRLHPCKEVAPFNTSVPGVSSWEPTPMQEKIFDRLSSESSWPEPWHPLPDGVCHVKLSACCQIVNQRRRGQWLRQRCEVVPGRVVRPLIAGDSRHPRFPWKAPPGFYDTPSPKHDNRHALLRPTDHGCRASKPHPHLFRPKAGRPFLITEIPPPQARGPSCHVLCGRFSLSLRSDLPSCRVERDSAEAKDRCPYGDRDPPVPAATTWHTLPRKGIEPPSPQGPFYDPILPTPGHLV